MLEALKKRLRSIQDRKLVQAFTRVFRGHPYRNHLTDISNVHRWVQSWVYVCMDRNAIACAQQPLKMYQKTTGRRPSKRLTRPVRKYLEKDYSHRITDDTVEIETHPFLTVFRNPNPLTDGFQLVWMTAAHLQLSGCAYWHVKRGNTGPLEFWPLPPQLVYPIVGERNLYDEYELRIGGQRLRFAADEIVHFRKPSVLDLAGHFGNLRGILEAAETNVRMLEYERALFENFAVPDVLISVKGETSGAQLTGLRETWLQEQSGWRKVGIPAMSPVEVEVQKLGLSMKDLQFDKQVDRIRDEIAAGFGVPLPVIKADGTPFNNITQGIALWKRNTIAPLLCTIAETINSRLMPDFIGGTPSMGQALMEPPWFVAFDDPTPEDMEEKTVQLQRLVQEGVYTINGALHELGEDPVEWGYEPWLNAGLRQPVMLGKEVEAGIAATQATTAVTSNPPVQTDLMPTITELTQLLTLMINSGDVEGANLVREAIARQLGGNLPPLDEILAGGATGTVNPDDQPEQEMQQQEAEGQQSQNGEQGEKEKPQEKAIDTLARYKSWVAAYQKVDREIMDQPENTPRAGGLKELLRRLFKEFHGDVKERFNREIAAIQLAVQQGKKPTIKGAIERMIDRAKWVDEWARQTLGIFVPVVQEGSILGATDLKGTGLEITPLTPDQLREVAKEFAIRSGQSIVETTSRALRDALKDYMSGDPFEMAENVGTIAKKIKDVFDLDDDKRSTLIARTELNNALNSGATAQWQQAGVTRHKWLASASSCEFCDALDGKVVRLGEPFIRKGQVLRGVSGGKMKLHYRDVLHPTLHPNCTCTVLPIVE